MSGRSANAKKSRCWAFVVYPESLPCDWLEKLQLTGLSCAVSPLHDRDLNADKDEEKKPHYHVIACWDGPTTYSVAESISKGLLNGTVPQILNCVKGYYRYFTHKDNPEKYQYDESEIVHIGGFNPLDYVELTKSELETLKIKILTFIREANLYEYADLLDILQDNGLFDLLRVAMNNTTLYMSIMQSRRHRPYERKFENE